MAPQAQRAVKRGWCPSLYEPMPSGDGLLVRVKPPSARLTAAAARTLADAAARFGNGVIEATSRGNLQLRGLRPDGIAPFAAAMVAAGLADPDPAVERRRCVLLSPLAGDDPAAAPDAIALAQSLDAMLARAPDLSAKFLVAVDAGGAAPLAPAADVVVRTDGTRHTIRAAGDQRTREAEATVGLVEQLVRHAAGGRLPRATASPAVSAGFLPYGAGSGAFGLGLPFGQTDAAGLHDLAGLAERFSDATLRISPWRSLFLGRVRAADLPALRRAAHRFILDPADPRLRIAACIGRDGCASGTVAPRRDAAALGWTGAGLLHLSGCAKGCAHPGPAAITLIGDAGRYGLVRNGTARDTPTAYGAPERLLA